MSDSESPAKHPGPLEAVQRRVLGVLVEKAKTTPDAYPLSLNALRTGSNQKSNRFPQMDLDEERVESAIESLRKLGALTVVQGDSRVERYRHRLYEWLGVEKAELAVLAELLLRGAQTVGELRGRAARMEPIASLAELTPIVDRLTERGYVEYLTPKGRGAVVSHTFYSAGERERVLRDLGAPTTAPAPPTPAVSPSQPIETPSADVEQLRGEVAELREEVARLRSLVEDA